MAKVSKFKEGVNLNIWFMVIFIALFLISTSFFLFFNPVVMKKPLIKIAEEKNEKKGTQDQENNNA